MKKHLNLLKTVSLFENIGEKDILSMLSCLGSTVRSYPKNSCILFAGDEIRSVGIILSGRVQIVRENYAGNRTIQAMLTPGDLFGETIVCAGIRQSPVTVYSAADCEIMSLGFGRILEVCPSGCVFHRRLIENMLKLLAGKNLSLNGKMDLLSRRTTREKLMAYCMMQMDRVKSAKFEVPFSRRELADFLCVERSAMSRELGRLRDEGLLRFHKNKFEILDLSAFNES